jgi:hypothetical protein
MPKFRVTVDVEFDDGEVTNAMVENYVELWVRCGQGSYPPHDRLCSLDKDSIQVRAMQIRRRRSKVGA